MPNHKETEINLILNNLERFIKKYFRGDFGHQGPPTPADKRLRLITKLRTMLRSNHA